MDFREFFKTLFGDSEGYIFIGTMDEEKRLNQYKAFNYPVNINQLIAHVEQRADEDCYFSPLLYSVPRRKSSTASVLPFAYADTDDFDPANYRVAPTMNVSTSPTKTHSYWLLDRDDYTVEEVKEANRAIALTHAEKVNGVQKGVDPSGWDLVQMLRIPGTAQTNPRNKPGYPEQFTVHVNDTGSGATYTLEEITAQYDPANLPQVLMAEDSPLPEELPEAAEVLRKIVVDDTLRDLYTKEPYGDWSDTLYLFCCELFRAGFTPEEVLVAAWNSAANKYKRDGRPMAHLWQYDVLKAHADPANAPRPKAERDAIDREPAKPKDEGVASVLEAQLIAEEERQFLTETYVDKYVNWASSKTDAPAPYHVAGAMALMSCVLGEWGVAYPQFGEMRLGLNFIVMGETTESRKSTARNLFKNVLRKTQVMDYEYILTSDVTPETLVDTLADRPHQASLYDRDEFQALIHDVKHKSYMGNFFETLNELYDGWARGRLRKDRKTKDTPVNFVQYGMGIRSQIQENLEVADFKSGYLPRNIFVRGEAPARTREGSRLRQGNAGEKVDREFVALVRGLTDARNFWSKSVGDRSSPAKILFDDDAWERWNDFEWDLREYVKQHPKSDLLLPSVQRLAMNVLKVAVLFAMMDQRQQGNMSDIINAIYYGTQWVEDLIIVAEGVSENMYQRELDKIEQWLIAQGGLVTYPALLKWSVGAGMRKRDLMEYVDHLISDRTIDVVDDAKGRKSVRLHED